jgi:SOS response regulatory protein OraA/RecX
MPPFSADRPTPPRDVAPTGHRPRDARPLRVLDEPAAYSRALRALGQRAMSSAQMDSRLTRAGAPPEVAARVVARLVAERWIDDVVVAAGIARRGMVDHGWSDRRIRLAMVRAGIPPSLATEALEAATAEHPEARAVKLDRLAARKWAALDRRTELDPRVRRQRFMAWLARRGVDGGEIRRLTDRFTRRTSSG